MFCHTLGLLAAILFGGASAQDLLIPNQPDTKYGKEYTKDAQGFNIRRYTANLDASGNHTIGGRPHWILKDSFVTDLSVFPEICDSEIAEDTCRLFNGDPGDELQHLDSIVPSSVQGVLSASAEAVVDFWNAAGLPVPAKCVDLCHSAVSWLEQHAHVVPPKSDLGCHQDSSSGEHVCDIDLSPGPVHDSGSTGDEGVPDAFVDHRGDALDENSQPVPAKSMDDDDAEDAAGGDIEIEYKMAGIAVEIAHMFRIYPEVVADSDTEEDLLGDEDGARENLSALRGGVVTGRRLYGGSFEDRIRVTEQKAIAYIATALREFQRRGTKKHMDKWFGWQAHSSSASRAQVQKVLRSINSMLSDVEYVYPGPQCQSNVYAYVYPQAYTCSSYELKSRACTKTHGGKFVFYMCQLTMKSQMSVQIETLTHEGSHHATAYTDDVCMDNSNPCKNVAYGRAACEHLARISPHKALKNADNYCYYIQDITDISSGSSPIFGPGGGTGGGSGSGGGDIDPDALLFGIAPLIVPCCCCCGVIALCAWGGAALWKQCSGGPGSLAWANQRARSQETQMRSMPQPAVPRPAGGAQMQVQVPQGCAAGSQIQVKAPDGRAMVVTVPPGHMPGNVFLVSY